MTDVKARPVERLADGYAFLEGPRWRDGQLFVSDFYQHQVLAFGADGAAEVICEVANQPSGLGFTPEGELLVVSMLDRRLLRVEGDRLVEVADITDLTHGPANDMVVDAEGRAYIGNFGTPEFPTSARMRPTNLVRVDPDGHAMVAAEDMVFPNGMVITHDGRTLLVAESFACRITAFDLSEDGSLGNRRQWWALGPTAPYDDISTAAAELPVLPDGIALDSEGGCPGSC